MEPQLLLVRVMRHVRRKGFDTDTIEVQSDVGFAVANGLATYGPLIRCTLETWCCRLAYRECVDTVRREWADVQQLRDVALRRRPWIGFCDGHRFATLPWGSLREAMVDLDLEGPIDLDHISVTEMPPFTVPVSAGIFDRLLGEPTG